MPTAFSSSRPMWAKVLRFILPVFVLLVAGYGAWYLATHRPQAKTRPPAKPPIVNVQVLPLTWQGYQVSINSFGTIQPRSQGALVSQVAGSITKVSPNFVVGGFFEQGEVLVEVDNRDYLAALQIAEAALIQARLALTQEQAKAEQAKRDWQRLGKGKPTELVLRKPQLAAAQANVASAKAKLSQAKLDLERTQIKAPYAGRLLTKQVDLGQFVGAGASLADIYAVDYVEVRLPLSEQQQALVSLPELFRQQKSSPERPQVTISARFGRNSYNWQGEIERTESALDANSRQLYAIARIDDPYGRQNQDKPPLKIGQFVDAQIQGKSLERVMVLPRNAVYQGNQVIMFQDGVLLRKTVAVIWADNDSFIVDGGLSEGDLLVTTPLGNIVSGTRAKLAKELP
ncbi:efflux RND transporter periplasmic adaptor subunit [Motilimonas sp. 1_MG-2023]|uniref:efflux RND transporter periplasmic adaptor subunit n=1 Tax=Motilimonas sp. 1_MG-2023 TaxID=3062672 RepID=UPI0026E20A4A|nr:efflux RND transporter periplasmic adaptor subunit [Motilimonas sp. 1_MG-2023]MDO6527555.1 efflux RND transporter periplasmic adaptor subunit [Motilimonas sp. 1_MG-2023]